MSSGNTPAVQTRGLGRDYGAVTALRSVDISIDSGEYFVLLGPSGGGKTTLLRALGGFIKPTRGDVQLHGRSVANLPPNKRPTSMVFQSYALFPHMSVERNVGYGLTLTGESRSEIERKTARMLDMVGLAGYGSRMPHELSGGQQQRVQLARCLVLDRSILLLDEPLAALDAQLRKDMCLELKALQEQVGITFVHVTHNQEEALTVADRIALIADGDLIECGSAREIYERPRRRFTAGFVGENNLLDGTVEGLDRQRREVRVDVGVGSLSVPLGAADVARGDAVSVSFRSELVSCVERAGAAPAPACNTLPGVYRDSVYLGLTSTHRIALPNDAPILIRSFDTDAARAPLPGAEVELRWPVDKTCLHTD